MTASLFRYGRFTEHDTRMVGASLTAMSFGIPAFMLSRVLLSAFFARQDTRTPMWVAIATVAANVLLTVSLVTPLWMRGVEAAHVGIAAATAAAGILNALLLWRILRRRGLYVAEPGWWRWLGRIALGLAAMAAAVLVVREWVGQWTALSVQWRWIWLLAAVAAGALAYGGVMLATGLRLRHLRGP